MEEEAVDALLQRLERGAADAGDVEAVRVQLRTRAARVALLGSAAHERGDAVAAVGYWRRVLAEVPADSDIATSLRDSIAKVQAR